MRRFSLFLTLALMLVLSFGLAHGQNAIYVTSVAGEFGSPPDDTLQTGTTITWTIAFRVALGDNVNGSNNGFIIFSPDGATWGIPVLDTMNIKPTTGFGWDERYDGIVGIYNAPSNNGSGTIAGADTVGIGGFSIGGIGGGVAFQSGFDFSVVTISLPGGAPDANSGLHICLDSSGYEVSSEWLWSAIDTKPDWIGGQKCYTLFDVPNQAPNITNCQASITQSHCTLATKQFTASDPDLLGARPLTFIQNSGPGSTTLAGMWSYAPTLADVGASLSLSVSAQDDPGNLGPACVIALNFTNACPTFTDGCGALVSVGKGNSAQADVDAASNDCDPITYSLGTPSPVPVGTYSINPSTGTVTFNSDEADGGDTVCFPVFVSDGNCADTCEVCFEVLVVEPFTVVIEKTHNTIQGGHEQVCISLTGGSEEMWGFDFLIAYDNSALSLVGVSEGEIYAECAWEYFNWRHGANGNCSNGCPTGLVRVVGLAETNNGAVHPDCFLPPNLPTTLFCLDFLVTNDRTFECQYVPVRFFWVDCGDNTISFNPSDDPTGFVQQLAVSRSVVDFGLVGDISDGDVGFPTFQGAQDFCLTSGDSGKPAPIRFIDFFNGGVDIVCADSIDDRGDVNMNGLANEIADAVLFTNYFIYGISVFTVNVAGQIAATDVNADGLTLSVADLVYLIRIVIGDATPFAKLAPVAVSYTRDANGVMSIKDNVQIGAAFVVVSGETTPKLIANNMEMVYAYDGANTRVLVWSRLGNSFTGDFLNVTGQVVSLDMATFEGQPVALEVLPTEFALNQNYPNPFNPKTRISFTLPSSSDYTLTIYNVTGQKVTEFTGSHEAGTVELDVDATNYSSGVYFYKLIADNGRFTETKKMVLVK